MHNSETITHKPEPSQVDIERAEKLQYIADLLCDIRKYGAVPVGVLVAAGAHSPIISAASGITVGLGHYSDKIDGDLAREAHEILGTPTTPEGAKKDEEADKWWFYSIMGGLIVKSVRQKNYGQATFLGGITAVSIIRDVHMSRARNEGRENNINVAANRFGQAKTGLYAGGTTTLASPIATRGGNVERTANAILVTGLAIGVGAFARMRTHVNRALTDQKQQ